MAINLVSLVQQFLTPQMVGSLARAVGVNEAVAQKLVAAALPAILAALATAAAAPGGAQKVSDAISNSDPDLLGALSQHAGAPQAAAQPLIGAVTNAVVGTIGQQDPSNWSDPSAILSMFNSQKSAIAAALPGDVSKALGASGLLAGLGGAATAAAQTATSTVSSAAGAANSTASSAARSAQAASRSSAFPMWAIILIVVVVLVAIYWFVTQSQKPAEPAKTGMFDPSAPIEYALQAAPSPVGPKRG